MGRRAAYVVVVIFWWGNVAVPEVKVVSYFSYRESIVNS